MLYTHLNLLHNFQYSIHRQNIKEYICLALMSDPDRYISIGHWPLKIHYTLNTQTKSLELFFSLLIILIVNRLNKTYIHKSPKEAFENFNRADFYFRRFERSTTAILPLPARNTSLINP